MKSAAALGFCTPLQIFVRASLSKTKARCSQPSILADGTNLGLERMAHASQDVTKAQLAWIQTWYLREQTYRAALGAIVNAYHAEPMAAIWGSRKTSSSDGQFFRAGWRGHGSGEINAKYGIDPGMLFYTHISDQYGPFHGKIISATLGEAPHVLDGLLHHGTVLTLKEHYTDTGGANDHVFALCHLLGFRFVPRLSDFQLLVAGFFIDQIYLYAIGNIGSSPYIVALSLNL